MRASRALLAAAFVAAAAPAAHAAEDLGTLFFTPQERAALDRLRRGEPQEARVAARVARHSVTGFVRRSDERNTVWIDGAPVPLDGTTPEALLKQKRDAEAANGGVRIERKPPRQP